jgi:hypothetical protein
MKRKLIILLALTVATVGITACGKTETTETEPTEVVETTEVVTEDTETERVEETESDTESLAEGIDSDNDGTIDSYDTNVSSGDYTEEDTNKVNESAEIENSKWADVNGAWDAVHQFTLYARENGADATSGWCWLYYTGEGVGSEPSYAVYMKEDDPLYGTVYHLGDYLPNGTMFTGKGVDEYSEAKGKEFDRFVEEQGYETYTDEDGREVIVID